MDARLAGRERQVVDDLIRSSTLPNVNYLDLIEQARGFLAEHPQSRYRGEVDHLLDEFVKTLDDRDIEKARSFSKANPTDFARRMERYSDYLKAHKNGGRYISVANQAKDQILRDWDNDTYRRAYNHLVAHPNDIAEVARLFHDYSIQHPEGRRIIEVKKYLEWWDKVSATHDYRVTLRSGTFESRFGSTFGGAPDLGVVIEVAGVSYGPTPVIRNNYKPIWDHTFTKPIRWKLGDPVAIKVIDHGYWSDETIIRLNSEPGDPLAIRNISHTIHANKGGGTTLVFASDFKIPELPRPD